MLRYLKKLLNFVLSRLFLVGLMLFLQLVVLFSGAIYFSQTFVYVYAVFAVLSMIAAIAVVSAEENPSYKITWVIAILFFPSIGWLFYLLFGNKRMPAKLQRRIDTSLERTQQHMCANSLCESALEPRSPHLAGQCRYIYNMSGYPLLEATGAEYYPVGEAMFRRMLEELRKAERYIFLEYFIIRPGLMWDSIFEILREKAAAGVEVRLMYDDLGSITTLPYRYKTIIRDAGVKLCVFNPFRPRVSVILNHRDHRKLTIIDGKVAFCGGINLADEYINKLERFGHWKDTGVLLRGDAVWPFAFLFLQQWQFSTDEYVDFDFYHHLSTNSGGDSAAPLDKQCLVQPFGDTPLDNCNVTEQAYLGAIAQATRYIYITTPYLVIDHEMETALCAAAQGGVDVRIVTPHIYDKWYVHILTQSHYPKLIRAGVKIYEYTPGFMHGKMFVADDRVCMVGTCNMDFRSFYLHFECSALFYYSAIVEQVKADMLDCQQVSHLVTAGEADTVSPFIRILRAILKLFAPLL